LRRSGFEQVFCATWLRTKAQAEDFVASGCGLKSPRDNVATAIEGDLVNKSPFFQKRGFGASSLDRLGV